MLFLLISSFLLVPVFSEEISEVCFPTWDNHCLNDYQRYITNSESTIHIAAYAFGSQEIAKSLKAKSDVWKYVVLDKYTTQSWWGKIVLGILRNSKKIAVYEYVKPDSLMHNKFTVIDMVYVQTGSINYSDSGFTKNSENMIFIQSENVAEMFCDYFEHILNNSKLLFKNN